MCQFAGVTSVKRKAFGPVLTKIGPSQVDNWNCLGLGKMGKVDTIVKKFYGIKFGAIWIWRDLKLESISGHHLAVFDGHLKWWNKFQVSCNILLLAIL